MCEKWKVKGQLQLTVCTFQLKYQKQLRSVTFAILSESLVFVGWNIASSSQGIIAAFGCEQNQIVFQFSILLQVA